ncbi:ABC transporter substrate-binding protein [Megalodesulfovibrio gigas]|nr:ABC transporter substrate-binding protein [Megalodesulfovibrio gigas]
MFSRSCFLLLLAALMVVAGCAGRQAPSRTASPQSGGLLETRSAPTPQPVTVLLVLPLGNAYGAFASKVAAGAQIAVARLARDGVRVQLQIVDTAAADWLDQVMRTSPSVLIGGPMLAQDLMPLLSLAPRRQVFALMPEFPTGLPQEGRDAWRFFTSPRDHIETMLTTARDHFGVKDVGVLYPDESFGQRRAQLFQDVAREMGMLTKAAAAYDPAEPLRWNRQVAAFLEQGYAAGVPGGRHPGMEAVFLPDAWSQAQMLVPLFSYYQEDHMLVLGSALWDQTLAMRPEDQQPFRLAMFPGAWWEGNAAPEARALVSALGAKPDYWHALGYDFIRFAATMGPLPANADAQWINTRLQAVQHMAWSMAPLRWNARGMASQRLFVFAPTPSGPVPANLEAIRSRFAEAARNYRIRMNGMP